MKSIPGYTLFILTTILVLTIWPVARGISSVAAAPTFTGNAPVDFVGPNVVKIDDPSFGIGVPDVGMPSQFPDDRISGWDMNAVYFEYDAATDIMYVGIDCFGICGDADSDGDPGNTGPILEGLQSMDIPDFGNTESFALLIDTDNDCDDGAAAAIDAVVGVSLGVDITGLGAFTFVGSPLSPSTGFGAPLPNQLDLFANPSADAPDLEFSISDFSTLPGFSVEPGSQVGFQVNAFMGSLQDDGIGEDFLTGPTDCLPVVPPMETPVPPTETATETPVSPTDTPTETPTDTPIPTSTDTQTPTVPPPTMPPPTEPPPTMPPPTMPPSTVPPPTGPPPPTMLPPTGPDASVSQSTDLISAKAVVPYHGPSPQRIEIDSIGVASTIMPMSWYYTTDPSGSQMPQWQVVDYAVGWHINSAHVGEKGNVVMSGHNTVGGSVFQDLPSLKHGDRVSIWNDNQTEFTYIVDEVKVVPEKEVDVAQQDANAKWLTDFGDERLTLVSCWPNYDSAYRVIVVAHREMQ